MATHFDRLMSAVAIQPDARVAQLDLLGANEREARRELLQSPNTRFCPHPREVVHGLLCTALRR